MKQQRNTVDTRLNETDKYALLRSSVETYAGFSMKTRRHFDLLAEMIFVKNKELVSATTLRRFWGYQEKGLCRASIYTLDILSKLVGYNDWAGFCNSGSNAKPMTSELFHSQNVLDVGTLEIGQHVQVAWHPDRKIVIEFLGEDAFRVLSSEHSKLHEGDTFHCKQIVANQPMFCSSLLREGYAAASYICGISGGLTFTLIHDDTL